MGKTLTIDQWREKVQQAYEELSALPAVGRKNRKLYVSAYKKWVTAKRRLEARERAEQSGYRANAPP
jgi:hypothetical protein